MNRREFIKLGSMASLPLLAPRLVFGSGHQDHDVVVMPPNHPAVEGPDAVKEWFKAFPRASQFSLSISDIGGYGDVAYVRGHATMTLHPEGAAEPVDEVMKYVEIRKKQEDGSWPLAVDIFNSDKE